MPLGWESVGWLALPLPRVFGIPVKIHIFFFVLLGLQLLGSIYYGADWVLLWFLVLGPLLLLTVFIHELGHCWAARSVGGTIDGILLWPLGGLAFVGHSAGPKADMWVAVAGPLTHIPMVAIWVGLLALATHAAQGTWHISLFIPEPQGIALWQALCAMAVVMNISLFCFNLLVPAYPLDGGRLLVDTLLTCGLSLMTTAKVTVGVAIPIGIGLVAFGAYKFQVVTIMVGLLILYSSWQLLSHIRDGTIAQHPMFVFGSDSAAALGSPGPTQPAVELGSAAELSHGKLAVGEPSSRVGVAEPSAYTGRGAGADKYWQYQQNTV